MAGKITLPKSGMTGKATTATARALGQTVADLEIDIRKLVAKKNKTAQEKKELATLRKRLRDTKAELAEESSLAGRSLNQAASDRKKFKGYDPAKDPMAEKERVKPRKSDMTKEEIKAAIEAEDAAMAAARKKAKEGRSKGGVMGYNAGGAVSRKGSFDYRKGGMFK